MTHEVDEVALGIRLPTPLEKLDEIRRNLAGEMDLLADIIKEIEELMVALGDTSPDA